MNVVICRGAGDRLHDRGTARAALDPDAETDQPFEEEGGPKRPESESPEKDNC